jgi:hypothetical protein
LKVERLPLTYEGEYGIPPKAKLILMKNNKHGVLLEIIHRGDGVTREKAFLIPKGEKIKVKYEGETPNK